MIESVADITVLIATRNRAASLRKALTPLCRADRTSLRCEVVVIDNAGTDHTPEVTLRDRNITPHMLRHTAAMELMNAGIDRSLIAIWLGHESVETTQIYLDAKLSLKEQIPARSRSPDGRLRRFHPDDQLLAFLHSL